MKKVVLAACKKILVFTMLILINANIIFAQQEFSKDNTSQFLYGIVSWYGDGFDGKITASGELYSPNSLTAAHRSLPFGTRVQIENLSNGKKVEVLINDRGPFVQNRILELSKQAADILGFLNEGTSFVKATIIELGTTIPTPIGLPNIPMGKDIPQNFIPTQDTIVTNVNENELQKEETLALSDDFDDLFTEEELDYMDDGFDDLLATQEQNARSQGLKDFANTSPPKPMGFLGNTNEFLIDDPLSNMTIGSEDEFVIVPLTIPTDDMLNTAPQGITSEEGQLLQENNVDPFADLFNDAVDPYQFQEALVNNSIHPIQSNNEAQNIGSKPKDNSSYSDFINNEIENDPFNNVNEKKNIMPEYKTNTITTNPSPIIITNYVAGPISTNVIDIPQPPNSIQASPVPIIPQKLGDHYIIQLGAFSKQKNALSLYNKLRDSGFNAFITDVKIKGRNLIRVRVGYFSDIDEAIQSSHKLEAEHSIKNRIIKVDYDETK